ncbi:MAG: phenylalanine--tRNA ligase subunit beta, partial [Legionella sp. 21-45-4]
MKVSEKWLRVWIDTPLSADELSTRMTMAGLEVDALTPVAGLFDGVVVARVLETRAHPKADRLTLCRVDADLPEILHVVCGASNVRPGLIVALAKPGANLPGDIFIQETHLRGELSQGMLCSAAELGFGSSAEGILELPEDAPIGTDLREYLHLDDQVFDIDLTPNRADCLSIHGVAREVGALIDVQCQSFAPKPVTGSVDVAIPNLLMSEPTRCPSIAIRVLQGINPHATTPLWMEQRIRRCGLSTVHPVVDVLNYVMLECGQPMHAYDLSLVSGEFRVRLAQSGESIALLNTRRIDLNPMDLVIADDKNALSLAGIMGGDSSSIQADSVNILLESAYFDPIGIAHTARRFNVSSDSSVRFERGVDPTLHVPALEYATQLLIDIMGGTASTIR